MNRVRLARELQELKIAEVLASEPWLLACDEPFAQLMADWSISRDRLLMIPDIGANGAEIEAATLTVVCTEGSEELARRRLTERGMANLGLFGDIMPRLAAKLPPLYRPPGEIKSRLEYAILCLPRCGSTLVSRELKIIGAGDPVEHFRGFLQDLLRERASSRFDLIQWWELVRAGRRVDGVFGTKIIWDFWKMAERFMTTAERGHILAFLARAPVIHIERADKYAQAASDVIARKTGVWHLWNEGMKGSYRRKLEGLEVDFDEAVGVYRKFSKTEHDLKELLHRQGARVIRIDYDDLIRAPKAAIARAAESLGLLVPAGYLSSALSLHPTESEAHKRLADRLRRELG